MTVELGLVAASYLMGSIPSALIVVRLATGRDVRSEGSGNVGATNATRSAGLRVGVVVTVIDIAKGALPVLAMSVANPSSRWLAAAMVAAVLGHCYPVWLRFKGGKGVATGFGAFLVVAPLAAAVGLAVWIVVLAIWRMVSLASMLATVVFPVVLGMLVRPPMPVLVATSLVAVIVVLRHARNIRHILDGTERRIGDDGGEL